MLLLEEHKNYIWTRKKWFPKKLFSVYKKAIVIHGVNETIIIGRGRLCGGDDVFFW